MVETIDHSFDEAAAISLSTLRHPTDASLTPLAMLPVLPDEDCWANKYVQMSFDFDPSLEAAEDAAPKYSRQRVRKALVRGHATQATATNPSQSYAAYLLPDEAGAGHEWVREYAYSIKKHFGDNEGFFFVAGKEQVTWPLHDIGNGMYCNQGWSGRKTGLRTSVGDEVEGGVPHTRGVFTNNNEGLKLNEYLVTANR